MGIEASSSGEEAMRKILFVFIFLACYSVAFSQVSSHVAYQFRGGTGAPPATCKATAPTDLWYRTSNSTLYVCTSLNTWTSLATAGGAGGGITNTAPANTIMKSDGTNAVSSMITDTGSAVTITSPLLTVTAGTGNDALIADTNTFIVSLGDLAGVVNATTLVVDDDNQIVTITAANGLTLTGGSVAGNIGLGEGTATAVVADTVQLQAPAAITGYNAVLPGAAGDGVLVGANAANVVTFAFVATTGTGSILRQTASPYDPAFAYNGAPTASLILRMVVARAFNSSTNFVGTVCSAATAATGTSDFLVKKNGSTVATLRFAAAGSTCSIVSPTTTSFSAGDVLTITSPASPDGTLADVAITILGTLN